MPNTRAEMETIVQAYADSDKWDIWSDDRKVYNKLKRLGWKGKKHGETGWRFLVPLKAVTFRTRKAVEEPKARGKRAKS